MAGLLGVDPTDPSPAHRREYRPGSGGGPGAVSSLPYLVIGNKTSGGTETVDAISLTPIADDADAESRLGPRSEAAWMYRQIRKVDPSGTIYVLCPTESGGTAAATVLNIQGTSDQPGTIAIDWADGTIEVPRKANESEATVAARVQSAINAAEGGRCPFTAAAPTAATTGLDVVVTAANIGPRGTALIQGASATLGLRVRLIGPTNTQVAQKQTADAVAGATEDDHTAAIAALTARAKENLFYYVVTPKSPTSAPTATDNGLGELTEALRTLALPINGVDTLLFVGLTGTNTEAVTVSTDAQMNLWTAHCTWAENNDWPGGWIAAYMAAQARKHQIAYPAANINGLAVNIPRPRLEADVPTDTEIRTALDNGIIPITYERGAMRIKRFITNQSLNSAGSNDYKVREGHIPRCLHSNWELFFGSMTAKLQPNADDDPPEGQLPPALTTTPADIVAIYENHLNEMCSNSPYGLYPGPIMKPSAKQEMLEKFSCVYNGGGSFSIFQDKKTIEHLIKTGTVIAESGQAY